MMQNPHHYPWCHAPSRVECSQSGEIFTMGHILSEELRREHASPTMEGSGFFGPFVLRGLF